MVYNVLQGFESCFRKVLYTVAIFYEVLYNDLKQLSQGFHEAARKLSQGVYKAFKRLLQGFHTCLYSVFYKA
jgi:Fe-S oxidoreductase